MIIIDYNDKAHIGIGIGIGGFVPHISIIGISVNFHIGATLLN